jgi:hypothetical protein
MQGTDFDFCFLSWLSNKESAARLSRVGKPANAKVYHKIVRRQRMLVT